MKILKTTISRSFSPYKSFTLLARGPVVAVLLLCAFAPSAIAQCTSGNLTAVSDFEKNSLVIDVRPDQINQFKGKSSFKDEARIVLVNMNPFLFSYTLKVDQTEVQDTGFLNFLKLLGSPVSDLIGSVSASSRSKALSATSGGNIALLIARTAIPPAAPHSSCPGPQVADATAAIQQLDQVRTAVLNKLNGAGGIPGVTADVTNTAAQYLPARGYFLTQKDIIFDSSVEAAPLCTAADTLHNNLTAAATAYPTVDTMGTVLTEVRDFQSMVEELKNSALEYKTEYDGCPARANGMNYADNLVRLANELTKLGQAYETKVNAMLDETKGYDALVQTIAKLNGHENRTLQREYTVFSQYDISALDITATAVPLGEDAGLPRKDFNPQRVVGDTQKAQYAGNAPTQSARLVSVGATESAQGVRVFAPHRASLRAQAEESGDADSGGGGNGSENAGGAKQIKTTGTIGARRFEISAGMAFSSLDRREFQPVLGYPRNAQGQIIDLATGNPTNDRKLTKIVGVSEQSSRRFAPLAMLHYRLPFSRYIFASAGFTGKRDDYGVDLEYLIGPSVLYRNMFFTFGGYAGKQQKLAGDLFDGSPIEGDIPVRKDYKWGLGFSFTYKIPLGDKKSSQ
jgi:hypothetical protein